jgi:hypothetical protein
VLHALLGLVLLLWPTVASGQAIGDADRAAAKEHFARGVELAKAKNYAGALSQFEEAYEVAPFAVILYNLGVAHAKLDHPVEAVHALEKVIAEPGKLRADRLRRAKEIVAQQTKRIGHISFAVDQAGAQIRVDGETVGKAPLRDPHPVATGMHFVEVVKRGFAPFRKELKIAGGATDTVTVTLEATELAFAQVWIRTALPGVDVWLDHKRIGRTPLDQSFPVLPGKHEVELRRLGYHSIIERIEVGPGATAEIRATPGIDEQAVRREGGLLELDAEATEDLVVTVDGDRHGVYDGAIALAPGTHDVTVERAGFLPSTLRVFISKGGRLTRQVVMAPTPETVADHNASVALFQGLGWTSVALGIAAIGGGVGFTIWNENAISDAEDVFFPLLEPDQRCNDKSTSFDREGCLELATDIDDAKGRRPVYYALFIGGAAFIGGGIALLTLGPDADEYKPTTDDLEELAVTPVLAPLPSGGFIGLTGRF